MAELRTHNTESMRSAVVHLSLILTAQRSTLHATQGYMGAALKNTVRKQRLWEGRSVVTKELGDP